MSTPAAPIAPSIPEPDGCCSCCDFSLYNGKTLNVRSEFWQLAYSYGSGIWSASHQLETMTAVMNGSSAASGSCSRTQGISVSKRTQNGVNNDGPSMGCASTPNPPFTSDISDGFNSGFICTCPADLGYPGSSYNGRIYYPQASNMYNILQAFLGATPTCVWNNPIGAYVTTQNLELTYTGDCFGGFGRLRRCTQLYTDSGCTNIAPGTFPTIQIYETEWSIS